MRLLLRFKPTRDRDYVNGAWEYVDKPAPDPVLLSGVTKLQRVNDRYVVTAPSGPYIYMADTIDYMEMDSAD